MSAVGIDFGTTNSVLAQYSAGDVDVVSIDVPPSSEWEMVGSGRVFPSVFALGADREPLFGWRAKLEGRHVLPAVKRLFASADEVDIGGERFYVEEIAALLFGRMKSAALERGVDFSRAVVTVPANSRGLARYRTKICAGMAGIEVPALINEPTAAAMAFGLRAVDDQRILVVDWGGGTLDVTLLEISDGIFIEHSSKGIQRLGGTDFDREIKHRLTTDIPEHDKWGEGDHRRFDLDVEFAKIALTKADTTSISLPDGNRRELTRKRMDEWVRPLTERVAQPIATCLRDAGMTASGIDHLLLVGGTCMMPGVRDFIAEHVERQPSTGADPLTAVAEGASVAAAILAGEHDSDFFVSTEHALGTVVLGERGLQFSTIIPRNMKLPARSTEVFIPLQDLQEAVQMKVVEGDPTVPLEHEDNVLLREWDVSLIPRPVNDARIEISYEYDVDGLLHVKVTDAPSGGELFTGDVTFVGGRDKRELVQMSERVDTVLEDAARPLESEPSLPPALADLVERARVKVIPFVSDDEATRLSRLVDELVRASAVGESEGEQRSLEDALRKYAYLY